MSAIVLVARCYDDCFAKGLVLVSLYSFERGADALYLIWRRAEAQMWSVLSVAETWLGDACIETGALAEGSEESGSIFVSFVRRRESACCAMAPNKKGYLRQSAMHKRIIESRCGR